MEGQTANHINKKVLLHEENDETPSIHDLSAPVLCNPPAL